MVGIVASALALYKLGGLHRFEISIIRWQDGLVLVNNWAVKRGVWRSRVDGSREILVMLGATSIYKRSETKDGFPKFLGDLLVTGISWAHLLSSHSSRLICNADNSCWHILTAQNHQDKSVHWKNVIKWVYTLWVEQKNNVAMVGKGGALLVYNVLLQRNFSTRSLFLANPTPIKFLPAISPGDPLILKSHKTENILKQNSFWFST